MKLWKLFVGAGVVLIVCSLVAVTVNFCLSKRAERISRDAVSALLRYTEKSENGDLSDTDTKNENTTAEKFPAPYKETPDYGMPYREVDGIRYIGVLTFPSLSMTLPVAADYDNASLAVSPCRYTGTVYKDNMVVCGHNYYTHFGKLDRLMYGDEVYFTDVTGNIFKYKVTDIVQFDADQTKDVTSYDSGMTLFTCDISGNFRITVRLESIK